MAINPRVAARREAEIAFLNEEDERLKELGEKRKKEAAERSAAIKEKDLPGYDPNKDDDDFVFFSEEDWEEDDKDENWYKEFEEETRYLNSPTVRASITRSNNMYNAYKSAEEWLMSEGEDDLAKGFINNFRSAIGTGVEDFAFWLTENAPWYEPAQNVVEKNTAGKVEDQAQRNFGNAKANGVNGKVVDFLDNTSKNLGYSLLGFKAGDYAQTIGEGFDTYRNLREQGYSKEEAAKKSLGKTSFAILSTKADDYIGKNNKVDDVLFGKNGIVDKADDAMEYEIFKKIMGDDFKYDLDSFKKMKYNEPEKWAYSNELKNYLVKYPDSNKKYFDAFLELKKEKIKEGVLLPPKQKQAFLMPEGKHDPYHIFHRMQERNITDDDLKMLMKDSKVMFSQWNGQRQLFVGEKGACVIVKQGDVWIYKTAWFKNDNDEEFDKILEVLKNVGL